MDLTITTCKRLDYFKRTIDSFFTNCLDTDLISRVLIADDGSPFEEREEMVRFIKNRFAHGIEISTPYKKGHPASLNEMIKNINTEWFFHLEDDWEFIKPAHFIQECIDISQTDDRIKNITLRRFGTSTIIKDGLTYEVHTHRPKNTKYELKEHGGCRHPGFSLNPGLNHLPTLKKVGLFAEHFRWFEVRYAMRYAQAGFLKANTMTDYVKHIGEVSAYDNTKRGF